MHLIKNILKGQKTNWKILSSVLLISAIVIVGPFSTIKNAEAAAAVGGRGAGVGAQQQAENARIIKAGTHATTLSGYDSEKKTFKLDGKWTSENWFRSDFSYYGSLLRDAVGGAGTVGELQDKLKALPADRRAKLEADAQKETIKKHGEIFNEALAAAKIDAQNPGRNSTAEQRAAWNQKKAEQGKKLAEVTSRPEPIQCFSTGFLDGVDVNFAGCAAKIAYIFLTIASWFLWVGAVFFNYTMDFTLNIAGFMNKVPIVDLGWTTFRDISNLFFVFIILYIGISTIVGNSSYGIKSLLGKVIITAILINFSLFFTKAIIDVSNVFALQFYSKIMENAQQSLAGSTNSRVGDDNPLDDWDAGISSAFVDAMGLQEVWGIGAKIQGSGGAENFGTENQSAGLNSGNLIIVGFAGGIFILLTAFVFFAGAIMMLIRTIVLLFLMVLSPLAFMGGILPSTKGHVGEWWKKLFSNAIYAPVYMALMYVVISMVINNKEGTQFIDLFKGDTDAIGTLMTFVVLNALMIGCILVANKLGAAGSGWALSTARDIAGRSSFGLAGWTGRQTIGRGFDAWANSDKVWGGKDSRGMGGRAMLRLNRWIGGSSFDTRTTPLGKSMQLGEGAKGGYAKYREDSAKAKTEFGKSLESGAQRTYARSLAIGSRIGLGRAYSSAAKDTFKEALNSEITKYSEHIREIEDGPERRLKELKRQKEEHEKSPTAVPALTADEVRELATLQTTPVTFKVFDPVNGVWKDNPAGAVNLPDAIRQMRDQRASAQTWLRTKKHEVKLGLRKP